MDESGCSEITELPYGPCRIYFVLIKFSTDYYIQVFRLKNSFGVTSIVCLFLALWLAPALASELFDVPVTQDNDVPIEKFAAAGDSLIIWTPSDFGVQPPQTMLAQKIAKLGIEVWIADLHATYFIATGSRSSSKFRAIDIVQLIDFARNKGKENIFLMNTGRATRIVLQAAHTWQKNNPDSSAIRGLILFHPNLYAARPELQKEASYVAVAKSTNLPLYIFQPVLSTTHIRLPELRRTLEQGGAQIFIHSLPGVIDGFHLRPDDHLGKADIAARKILPNAIRQAVALLKNQKPVSRAAYSIRKTIQVKNALPGLRRLQKNKTPPLSLPDLDGINRQLTDYRGKVVLVNFWASWCPPCIEEIPSMQRLYKKMENRPFEILAVNVGENKSAIRKFRKRLGFEFPVLLDQKGHAYKKWKVYVYPSNFLLDAHGLLRFGAPGGVVWDSPEAIATINDLLEESNK